MLKPVLFLCFFVCTALCCELNWSCSECVQNDCEFVVTKDHKKLCVKDQELVENVRSAIESLPGCKVADKIIARAGQHAVVRVQMKEEMEDLHSLPTRTELVVVVASSSTPTEPQPISKIVPSPVSTQTTGRPFVPDTTTTPTVHHTEKLVPPSSAVGTKNTTRSTRQMDHTLTLSNEPEIFLRLPTSFSCEEGERNESLLVAYASSLCSISSLSQQWGIEKFADYDAGYFLQNRARKFAAMCKAIKHYRNRCRNSRKRAVRSGGVGLQKGPISSLFNQIDGSWQCGNSTTEGVLNRLARIMCYSGDLFLELREQIQLNNFDEAYGLANPSFRHRFKCSSLYYKKRRCYK